MPAGGVFQASLTFFANALPSWYVARALVRTRSVSHLLAPISGRPACDNRSLFEPLETTSWRLSVYRAAPFWEC